MTSETELERLAAACVFPGFAGLQPPDWLRRWLQRGLGGVVLFSHNVGDRAQLAALTAALRAEQPELLVGIDEEGGDVTRLEAEHGSSYPGNRALGVVDDVQLTEQVGAAIGTDLRAVGVNLDFAPVADVLSNPQNPVIGVRSFGSDPELVARHVAAFTGGLQGAGVAACAKHFPGHGGTAADSHLELPTLERDRDGLFAEELVPFRAAIGAGVQAIMTAHIRLPALDEQPATLSRELLAGLLRAELGFDGLVITDALDMRAVSATIGVEESAVRALAAGADALCLGHDLAVEGVHRAIVDAVRARRLGEDRLGEAAERVRAASAQAAAASRAAPTGSDPELGAAAARRALESAGAPELVRPPLLVELRPEANIAAGELRHGLGDVLRARLPATDVLFVDDGSRSFSVPAHRQLVLVLRDAHRHAWQREVAEAATAATPDAIVVETGLPAWRPSGVAGYLATQGAGRVNLEAAADRLVSGG